MNRINRNEELCVNLMKVDSENEVISLLNGIGYWNDSKVWRYYGDRSSNFNTIGNQQSRPDAALVEKLVNSVDARLINECLLRGIDPESKLAPRTIREAVALFFENGSKSSTAGFIREWASNKRTEVARGITLSATGNKPSQGNPCFIISDSGEGQTPSSLPNTILSLDRDNKVKIPFVQGKFNMGGTGVLEFCGKKNLQLVVSRRNPKLLTNNISNTDKNWGFTVVRREDPIEGRKNSVYTYLAPLDADEKPNKGDVLSFYKDTLPIFPEGQNAYDREASWGTLIKLYEYSTAGFSGTNILLSDGLMRQLDLLLTDLALPIRLYECRNYSGHSGSFETNLTGIGVRLDDDKGSNLEDEPYSCSMNVSGEKMTANIYVFKKDKDKTYRQNEGIIFSLNGQTHGYLSKSFFRRKKVGMSYLADSILVIINCNDISARSREILFMPSRDRLRDSELKIYIENELEEIIGFHPGLRKLREKRRREEVETLLDDEKPLGEILQNLINDSPALASLFLTGSKLSNPFNVIKVEDLPINKEKGKKFPTYFKFQGLEYRKCMEKNCHINNRGRLFFETDAENNYFSREVQRGNFNLFIIDNNNKFEIAHTLNLWNRIATLNFSLPSDAKVGDKIKFLAITNDETQIEPFKNEFIVTVLDKMEKNGGGKGVRKNPPSEKNGDKREAPTGIKFPQIKKVARDPKENQKIWTDMTPPFNEYSALRIIHAGREEDSESKNGLKDIYDFFVNIDNIYLKTEQKRVSEQSDLLQAKFIYALVLLGLAVINYENQNEKEDQNNDESTGIEKEVENFSIAVAPVIIPIINELGDLDIEE